MHQDAVAMGRLLQNLSRSERACLVDHVKSGSRAYSSVTNSKQVYRSSRSVHVREIEELLVPTVRAGRVLLDRPDFVASMRQLDYTSEKILEVLAGYASDPKFIEATVRPIFIISIAASFVLAISLGASLFYLTF